MDPSSAAFDYSLQNKNAFRSQNNVVFRQIMGTKENLLKWADEQYKNSSQSYEKIVRKPRTCLAKAEREEIARFITKNKYVFQIQK